MVGRTLDVRLSTHRVYPAARNSNIRQQELQDGVGADILHAISVLGRAHSVKDRTRPARPSCFGEGTADLEKGA